LLSSNGSGPKDTEIFTEKVNAEKVGEYYKLVHVPAFASNIAYGDLAKIEFDDGEFHFDELIEESGFSVVHIVVWNLESKHRIISIFLPHPITHRIQRRYLYLIISRKILQ